MAVDVDGRPGPDGFGVRLYASHRRAKEATPIESGTLELMMFDGRLAGGELEAATPLKTWRFAAQELKARAQKTEIGTSYRFILSWGAQRPTKGTITIVARYEPLRGRPVRSGPGTIPMALTFDRPDPPGSISPRLLPAFPDFAGCAKAELL